MTASSIGLVLVSVLISATAQIAFKFGVSAQPPKLAVALLGPLSFLVTPGIIVGLSLYVLGTILWLKALADVELSQAYPFVAIGFVVTTVASYYLFDDAISAGRILGICFIVIGVIMVAKL